MSRFLRLSARPFRSTALVAGTTLGAYTTYRVLSDSSDSAPVIDAAAIYNSRPLHLEAEPGLDRPSNTWTPPSRDEMLKILGMKEGRGASYYVEAAKKVVGLGATTEEVVQEEEEEFDLLIVGGGATGAGVAVDAASRGLRVALVERDDFSSGEYSFVVRTCAV